MEQEPSEPELLEPKPQSLEPELLELQEWMLPKVHHGFAPTK
jgi:hypothetical protein